jgi:hypothetical protein
VLAPDAAPVAATVGAPDAAALVEEPVATVEKIRLHIESKPKATVFLDGKALGKTPLDREMDRGEAHAVLELRRKGYESWTREVALSEDISLEPTLERKRRGKRPPRHKTGNENSTASPKEEKPKVRFLTP